MSKLCAIITLSSDERNRRWGKRGNYSGGTGERMGDADEGDVAGRRMLLVTTDDWSVSCQIAASGAAAAGAAVVPFNGGRSRPGMAAAKTAISGSSGNRFASHEVSFFRSSSVISYIAIRSASVKFYNDRRGVFNESETLLS